jgi:hypothetical protein
LLPSILAFCINWIGSQTADLEVVGLGALGHFFLADSKRIFVLLAVGVSGTAFAAMRAWLPTTLGRLVQLLSSKWFWVPLCVLLLAAYVAILVGSTTYVGYLGHVEPNIASVSFILLKGAPLYHDADSAQRYSMLYGPMTYLPYAFALRVMGAKVLSLKLLVLGANLLWLCLLWRCYRQVLNLAETVFLMAALVSYFLISDTYVFQVRGDILIILCVALGIFAIGNASTWVSVPLLAFACACSFDIKITAPLYFLPLYVLFIHRHGWWPAAFAGIGACILAFVPFLAPQVSVEGYLEWLHRASREPLTRVEVSHELKVLPLVIAPLVLLLWQLAQRSRAALAAYLNRNLLFLATLGSCLAAVTVSAAKIGAGPHHFMPFYPIGAYVCGDIYREIRSSEAVGRPLPTRLHFTFLLWLWLAAAVAAQSWPGLSDMTATVLTSRSRSAAADVTNDLKRVMDDHPGKAIEMGYGKWDSYDLTFFRPMLVFAGNPLTIDALSLDDAQLSGLEIPHNTLEYLQQCKTQIWLIPKGDAPFSLVNVFSLIDPQIFPDHPLFSSEFRLAFFQQYRKQGASKYFDIWECRADSEQNAILDGRQDGVLSDATGKRAHDGANISSRSSFVAIGDLLRGI